MKEYTRLHVFGFLLLTVVVLLSLVFSMPMMEKAETKVVSDTSSTSMVRDIGKTDNGGYSYLFSFSEGKLLMSASSNYTGDDKDVVVALYKKNISGAYEPVKEVQSDGEHFSVGGEVEKGTFKAVIQTCINSKAEEGDKQLPKTICKKDETKDFVASLN